VSQLNGKIALVTGASKGIGAAIAVELAARGARVAVNYVTDPAGAQRAVEKIEAAGGQAFAVMADISSQDQVDTMFATITERFGPVDVLVNNAARYQAGFLEDVSVENYRHNVDTNVLGTMLVTRKAVEQFPAEGASIVNLGSNIIDLPEGVMVTYGASKAAVEQFTRNMARYLGPRNVRVNTVLAGLTATEGLEASGALTPASVEAFIARTPLGRIGTPEDVALVVAFLASDDARWVTGARVLASGGMY
jgi:3-oxoacyl-[acyl-carrier protein] reductase